MMMERLYESIKVRPHPNQLNAHFGSTTVDNAATTDDEEQSAFPKLDDPRQKALPFLRVMRPVTVISDISPCRRQH